MSECDLGRYSLWTAHMYFNDANHNGKSYKDEILGPTVMLFVELYRLIRLTSQQHNNAYQDFAKICRDLIRPRCLPVLDWLRYLQDVTDEWLNLANGTTFPRPHSTAW